MITPNSVIYHIITDRFDNEFGNLSSVINQQDYNSRFRDYLGGTFKGITNRAQYLEELGITNVLISPVCESKDYHGYNIENYLKVNPRFGTEEDLKKMIKELKKRDIGVIIDYVATHLSSTSPLFIRKFNSKRGKDWFIHKGLKNQRKYRAYYDELVYKSTQGCPEKLNDINVTKEYLGFFGLETSPLINLMNSEVIEFHKKILDYWIDNFGFSDVRFDSAYIQPREFIGEIKDHLKNRYSEISLITENWDFIIDSGRSLGFSNGEIDIKGVFLFNGIKDNSRFLRDVRDHYIKMKDLTKLGYSLILSLGNHDTKRFDAGPSFQKIAATIQFTLPETPLIYYGQEIPMERYNDGSDQMGQSRDPMRFDLLPSEMLEFYKNLTRFRRRHDFRKAEISEMKVNEDNQLFSYRLNIKGNTYYIIVNLEDKERSINTYNLFEDKNIPNFDITRKRRLKRDGKNILIIGANESCILGKE